MKGFDLLLNRIKEQPTKATLRLRYLALVADLESTEEKIATVLKLANFYRSGFPKEALEMAYIICRYDNTNIPAIEIIIEVMQLQGKETQAKLMSEYLSKIRRNLEVNSSNILKQIKYAAGEQSSDKQNVPIDNPSPERNSVWETPEKTSKVLIATTDPEVDAIKKANQDPRHDSFDILGQLRETPANTGFGIKEDALTVIIESPSRESNQLNLTGGVSGSDGLKKDILQLEVIEAKPSRTPPQFDEVSEETQPFKKSINLNDLKSEDVEGNTQVDNAIAGPDPTVIQGGFTDEKTHLLARDNPPQSAHSASADKTEIISPLPKVPAGKTVISQDEKATRIKKNGGGGGLHLDLEDYVMKSSDKVNVPEPLKRSKETKIFLELDEKLADPHSHPKNQVKVNENQVQQASVGTEGIKKLEDSLAKIQKEKIDSADKTTVVISSLSDHFGQDFPMEINPFDGKLPSKVNHQEAQHVEKNESIKLVLGRASDYPNAAEDKTRLSNDRDQNDETGVKAASSSLDQDIPAKNQHLEQRISTPNSARLHGESVTLRSSRAPHQPLTHRSSEIEGLQDSDSPNLPSKTFANQSIRQNFAGDSVAVDTVAPLNLADKNLQSSYISEGIRPTSVENDYGRNAQVNPHESQGGGHQSRSDNQQTDPFAFSTDEIPQLSGNKIFDNRSRIENENEVILKLQHHSAGGGVEGEAQVGFNATGHRRDSLGSSSFESEDEFGRNRFPSDEDHQSLDLSKKLDQLLSVNSYREALELLRNTAEKFSSSSWWKKGFDKIESSGLLSSNASNQARSLQSHEVQALAYRLLEATKNLLAPHEYLRDFFVKSISEADREKIFDFFFYEPLPGMELLQIDVYMALGASLEAAQLVRDRLGENFRDVEGLVRRARMIWHSLGWQPFSWHPEDGGAKLLMILSERPRQRPSADLL